VSPSDRDDDRADGIARALAALTAVAGLSALVAFTGGAIVWVRYEQAKLPADQAVAVTPNESLIAAGGAALGLFAVVGALAVLIAYLIDHEGTHPGQAVGVIVLAGIGIVSSILIADASWDDRVTAIIVAVGADLAAVVLAIVLHQHTAKDWLEGHRWKLVIGTGIAVIASALFIWLVLDERVAAGALTLAAIVMGAPVCLALVDPPAAKPDDRWWQKLWRRAIALGGHTVRALAKPAIIVFLAIALGLILDTWWIGVVVLVAGLLIAGVLAVAEKTDTKFRWYGAAVFVAVVIFGAAMNALHTWDQPRLQPMALLLTQEAGGGGRSGLYVAQSADRVYLGLVKRCSRNRDLVLVPGRVVSGSGQIVSVPRSSVAAEAVGSVGSLHTALERAPGLLDELAKRFGSADPKPAALPVRECADEGPLDLKARAVERVGADEAQTLASLYRPVLRFDRGERWRPLNIDRLLVESDTDGPVHRLCDGVEAEELHCPAITDAAQLGGEPSSPTAYVNFQGTRLGGGEHGAVGLADCPGAQAPVLQDCDHGPASAIYYRAVRANRRTYIDYWWFLRYNRFAKSSASELCGSFLTNSKNCFDHEGDWEGVTAVTAVDDPERLEFVDYAAHEGVFRYALSEVHHEGQRPVVFVANGSHAAYPEACPRDCSQVAKLLGHALPEDDTDGSQPWGRNEPDECDQEPKCLQALPSASWGAFAGFWGSRKCTGRKSCRLGVPPRSPGRQRRFNSPWCFSGPGLVLRCDGRFVG
jgi:hypothetical protein